MSETLETRVFVKIEPLPDLVGAARVYRVEEKTLLWIDPLAAPGEVAAYLADNLFMDELEQVPMSVALGVVPERLWLPRRALLLEDEDQAL